MQRVQTAQANRHDIGDWIRLKRAQKLFAGVNLSQISPEKIRDYLPDDFEFALDDVDVTVSLCQVFMAHRLKLLEALERKTPGLDREGEKLGPAPWDVVNESLSAAGFLYQVIPPTESPITEHYSLRLRDRADSNLVIPAIDLSSGEKGPPSACSLALYRGQGREIPQAADTRRTGCSPSSVHDPTVPGCDFGRAR